MMLPSYMPYNVLVVDADAASTDAWIKCLRPEFSLEVKKLAHQALVSVHDKPPNLIVVDSDLPDIPGLAFLKLLRGTMEGRNLPVILVSAKKTEESVVEAFKLGVDDYIAKPFDPRELLVRVRAVLRRKYERSEYLGSALSVGKIHIDPGQRLCRVAGKVVVLRPLEFALLEILMRKAGRILTRSYLLETVWGMSSTAQTRAVDVMVSRLRKCLGKQGPQMIETVSKMGYRLGKPDLG